MGATDGPRAFEGTTCLSCGERDQGDECADCYATRDNGRAGYLNGRHFTTYVEEVKDLKRSGDIEGAITLLWRLFRATEAETRRSRTLGGVVAPWYTEQLAICYRKLGRPDLELLALDAYDNSPANRHGPQFDDRRPRAEALSAKLCTS